MWGDSTLMIGGSSLWDVCVYCSFRTLDCKKGVD